jgi:hypothetical protein
LVAVCLFVFSFSLPAQSSNGTITGTVTDPAGAAVPGAEVEAKNPDTGIIYRTLTTDTGNYSIPNLPVGTYQISVKAKGFSGYTLTSLTLPAAAILKQDVPLQVSPGAETITVKGRASLLSAESGDLATNVTLSQLDNLPLIGIGPTNAGSSGIRNPYGLMQLIPGVDYIPNVAMIVNGLGSTFTPTEGFRIEGQDFTNHLPLGSSGSANVQYNQPSVDAIQEVAVQTSNYAAEYGTAGAGVINITMKSGTNQYHGTVYEYFVNEDLNAGYPFTVSTAGHGKLRLRNRRNDFGGALGGPLYIPKIYNGHNKTFFFWNYEEYIETNQFFPSLTVPTPDYLNGNFSKISPNGNCSLCGQYGIQKSQLGTTLDGQGNAIFANTIYDPSTRGSNPAGSYATPFPNNIIPPSRFDPVALKMESLFPEAQNANLIGNATAGILAHRHTTIPSLKIDEVATPRDKLSFYYSKTSTESPFGSGPDGLPLEIANEVGSFIYQSLYRLNYDRNLTPTLLLHLGSGWARLSASTQAPFTSFNPASIGLSGFEIDRQFPSVMGLVTNSMSNNYGGMQTMGPSASSQMATQQEKPTFNANLTAVQGRHTYKAGAELYYQGTVYHTYSGVALAGGTGPTSEPLILAGNTNGFSQGFGYASFLLGDYTSTTQYPQFDYRLGKYQFAAFLQDSWKVNRKLTLDYGLRYDLAGAPRETYGRLGEFVPTVPNANAGGHPGATQYANTCNCGFYPSVYPYGFGPRIGVAYQINPKTVFRGGWGVVYQYGVDGPEGGLVSSPGVNSLTGTNVFVNTQMPGFIIPPTWPVTDPNVYPGPSGSLNGVPVYPDRSQNRPPRINQWSVGFQREITRNLLLEAAYVANRAIWLGGGPGNTLNNISAAQYARYGLYPYPGSGPPGTDNNADFQLLNKPINSAQVVQKLAAAGVPYGGLPYPGFPQDQMLGRILYPFPQFPGLTNMGIANGESRYDALQVKATKRLSHGLLVNGTFSWSRAFSLSPRQDFYNPQSSVWDLQTTDQPFLFNMNAVYTTPKAAFLGRIKAANQLVKDWQIAAFTQYGSGALLLPPSSTQGAYFLNSEFYRLAGQPLYKVDINSHTFNPYYDQVLNPKAWAMVPTNGVGPAQGTFYSDFRGPRHPVENFNIGRNFRFNERMNLQFRGEFVNIFNRTVMPNPGTMTPQNQLAKTAGGGTIYTTGFGIINAYALPGSSPAAASPVLTPRTGTLILRFTF